MSELVCITLDGVRYAIRGDRVLSRERVRSLHRLPFADPRGGVLAMIGEHPETLADLSVCLGHSPTRAAAGVHALILSKEPPIRGFIAGGDLEETAMPDGGLVPVPRSLSGAPFEGFLARGRMPLPVIDITALYQQVRSGAWTAPRIALVFPLDAPPPYDPSMPHRVVDAGGVLYALAGMRQWEALRLDAIFHSPLLPPDIDGIAVTDGTADPVVDLGRRMGSSGAPATLAVLATVGDARLAVLIDEDRGIWEPGSTTCRTLPGLARPAGIAGVLQRSEESALLLDLGALLSESARTVGPAQPQPQAVSGSDFLSRFGHDDVEVQEVVLLGMRHALPKSEVRAVVPRVQSRRVPRAPAVVTGVAEYEGDLLPVLDLSAGFGGETGVAAGQDMIVFQSSGFRALLLSEKVLGERRVKVDDQRPVPYAASHPFLYGCYVDGEAVRLIFNIVAIAMQFSLRSGPDARIMLAQALGLAPESAATRFERGGDVPRPAAPAAPEVAPPPARGAPVQPDVTPTSPEPQGLPPAKEILPLETPAPSSPPVLPVEPAPVGADPPRAPADPEPVAIAPEAAEMHTAPELSSEEPQLRIPESPARPEARAPVEPAPVRVAGPEAGPERRPSPGARQGSTSQPNAPSTSQPNAPSTSQPNAPSTSQRWLAIAAAALVAAVAAVILLVPAVRVKVLPAGKVNAEAPAAIAPAQLTPTGSGSPGAGGSAPVETVSPTIYTVAEGDTLWSVAARLTGDPYQFRRLAEENGIANPDRIFPGQTIRLSRK